MGINVTLASCDGKMDELTNQKNSSIHTWRMYGTCESIWIDNDPKLWL